MFKESELQIKLPTPQPSTLYFRLPVMRELPTVFGDMRPRLYAALRQVLHGRTYTHRRGLRPHPQRRSQGLSEGRDHTVLGESEKVLWRWFWKLQLLKEMRLPASLSRPLSSHALWRITKIFSIERNLPECIMTYTSATSHNALQPIALFRLMPYIATVELVYKSARPCLNLVCCRFRYSHCT